MNPDGTGEFSTIGEALLASGPGDIIEAAPGTYHETLWIQKSVTIRSASGEPDVILDGEGNFRLMKVELGAEVDLAGLVFVGGFDVDASALLVWDGARVRAAGCVFRDCHATGSNAVHVRHSGSSATFTDCRFLDNTAGLHSAALSSSHEAELLVRGCVFAGNTSQGSAGAVNCTSGLAVFENNLFVGNTGLLSGALAIEGDATGRIVGNTFHGNGAPGYAAVRLNDEVLFAGNIVTASPGSFGIESRVPGNRHRNILFGNEAGQILGSPAAPGEMQTDPLFCDPAGGLFTLCTDSPALPGNNDGAGLIGAFSEGCGGCGSPGPVGGRLPGRGGLPSRGR